MTRFVALTLADGLSAVFLWPLVSEANGGTENSLPS